MLEYRLARKPAGQTLTKSQPAVQSRLLSRVAVLCGLLTLFGMMLASRPLLRRFEATLQPPANAFARWISPPPPPVIWDDLRLSHTKSVRLLLTWEARKSLRQISLPELQLRVESAGSTNTIVLESATPSANSPPETLPERRPEEQP
jgi:hypothetical protein